jgi:O-antigen ligase
MRGSIIGVAPQRWTSRRDSKAVNVQSSPRSVGRANSFAAWLALIGLIIPAAEVQIYVADLKFTVGRLGVLLLFLPALFILSQRGRRLLLSDLFACATAIWMIGASYQNDGFNSLSSAGAEAIELFGGYVVARAFFFGPAALKSFIRVLKVLAFMAIVLAIADSASGRLIVHDTVASIFNATPIDAQERMGMVRAASTFDHAILFGAFCSVVSAMLLYSESDALKRISYTGFCFIGAVLSLSSSSLMAFAIMLATYTYDRLMRLFPWRWTASWMVIGVLALAVILATEHPLGWILSNLTLDPESGYFRILEWDAAFDKISQSPWTGFSFSNFDEAELYSVDCVWLAVCLRFGIPATVLLFLSNVAACLPRNSNRTDEPYLDRMRTAFTLILVMFMFTGLTVHYWNFMWILWGLCIGIRASIREQSTSVESRSIPYSQPAQI